MRLEEFATPRSRRSRCAAAAISVAAAWALAPAADAKLPTLEDRTIVVGESIAGVALGDTAKQAKAAWGARGGQCDDATCLYRPGKGLDSSGGEGLFAFAPKVSYIELKAPVAAKGGHTFKPPFTGPKTSKGIGIGSPVAAVRRAYPAAESVQGSTMVQIKDAGVSTLFTYDSDSKRVFSIAIQRLSR